jgi:hypothetical protein
VPEAEVAVRMLERRECGDGAEAAVRLGLDLGQRDGR